MFNMTPEMRDFLLHMGGGLLMGGKNNAEALGRGLLMGAQGRNEGMVLRDRQKSNEQDRQRQQMHMDQFQKAQADRAGMQNAFQTAYGQPTTQQPDPREFDQMGEGTPMPAPVSRGGGGAPEFMRLAAPHMDPMQAFGLMQKDTTPLVLGKGAKAVDRTGREIASNPEVEKPDSKFGKVNVSDYTPESVRKFVASGNHADLVPYRAPQQPGSMQSVTVGNQLFTFNPKTGQYQEAQAPGGGPLMKPDKALTEVQGKGSLYLGMMTDSEEAIGKLKNFDPSNLKNQTLIAFARGDIPKLPAAMQNMIAGKEAQQYMQSTYRWAEAMLRQTTGANAPEPEVWRNARTYFPMPGDDAATVKQKNDARLQVMADMRIVAGPGAAQVDQIRAGRRKDDKKEDPLGIR
jgi:hypothetical protein